MQKIRRHYAGAKKKGSLYAAVRSALTGLREESPMEGFSRRGGKDESLQSWHDAMKAVKPSLGIKCNSLPKKGTPYYDECNLGSLPALPVLSSRASMQFKESMRARGI